LAIDMILTGAESESLKIIQESRRIQSDGKIECVVLQTKTKRIQTDKYVIARRTVMLLDRVKQPIDIDHLPLPSVYELSYNEIMQTHQARSASHAFSSESSETAPHPA
jgi:hypothetical protein